MILYELTPAVKELSETFHKIIQRRIAEAETPYSEVLFDVSAYHGKISALDEYRGKSGYLILQHLCLKSLDAQDFLLFSATLDDGTSLDAEVAEKFFEVFASAREASGIPEYIEAILAKNADLSAKATVNRVGESNNEHFKEASEKLERWRDLSNKKPSMRFSLSRTKCGR